MSWPKDSLKAVLPNLWLCHLFHDVPRALWERGFYGLSPQEIQIEDPLVCKLSFSLSPPPPSLKPSVIITFPMGIFLSVLDYFVYGSHAWSTSLLIVINRVNIVPMKLCPQWVLEGWDREFNFIVTLLQHHNNTRKNVNKNFWMREEMGPGSCMNISFNIKL